MREILLQARNSIYRCFLKAMSRKGLSVRAKGYKHFVFSFDESYEYPLWRKKLKQVNGGC